MKINKNNLTAFSIILFLSLIYSSNISGADYEPYLRLYNSSLEITNYLSTNEDILFIILCQLGNLIRLSYNQFLFIFSFIGLQIFWKTITLYSNKPFNVMLCYFIFPFFVDVIQVRNFMGYIIVFYAFRYLIYFNSKKDIFKYIFLILIASGFHKLMLVYLIFILTIYDYRYIKKHYLIMGLLSIVIVLRTSFIENLLLGSTKYSVYVGDTGLNSMSLKNTLGTSIVFFMLFILTFYIQKKILKLNELDIFMRKFNVLTILLLVLMISLGNNFIRIYRNLIPFFYIYYFSVKNARISRKNYQIIIILISIYPIVFLLSMVDFNIVVIPVIKDFLRI